MRSANYVLAILNFARPSSPVFSNMSQKTLSLKLYLARYLFGHNDNKSYECIRLLSFKATMISIYFILLKNHSYIFSIFSGWEAWCHTPDSGFKKQRQEDCDFKSSSASQWGLPYQKEKKELFISKLNIEYYLINVMFQH